MDCVNEQDNYPSLVLEPFIYESEKETVSILENLVDEFDLLLFAGPIPYMISLQISKMKQIPSTYIPYHGTGVLRALYQAQKLGNVSKFSIDIVDMPLLLEAFDELRLVHKPSHIIEYKLDQSSDELVAYHTKLYKEGQTIGAVTGLASCYKELLKKNVPVVRINPFKSVIRGTLDKVKLICDSSYNMGNQISVGFISINHFDKWSQGKNISEIQKFNLQLEYSVLQFMKELDGQYLQPSPREFLFFTTRIFIDNATKGFTRLPSLFNKSDLPNEVKLNLGIGIGGTTNLAANSAKVAAENAKDKGGNSCFIVNENQQLIEIEKGLKGTNKLDLRTTDKQVLDLADSSGLSTLTLERVFRAIDQVGTEFTANEIASFMGISVKSTQKILKYLNDVKAITIIGKETMQARGRPRRIYKLTK